MPVHDWTRVSAGTFHDFHSAWIIHLKEALNNGLLPEGYYALSEQHAGRVIAIRHSSNHRLIALIEVVSPANKDRASSVSDFVQKARSALQHGCHRVVVDLFPPSAHDPEGMHGAIWECFGPAEDLPRPDKPLTLASYVATDLPDAYVEFLAVGDPLPEMALFLESDWYISLPLESSYQQAYRGVPAYWKAVVERNA